MPKLPNQKLKLVYLSAIFRERTDRQHGLTLAEISAALREYGIGAERKSLYDDIEALRLSGMDIQVVRDSRVRYYLNGGAFELAELRLLADAVQSSKFLTARKSNELLRKLEGLGSKYEASQLHKQVYSAEGLKTENEEIYGNIVAIHQAIAENRKIRFKYFEWNAHKQRMLRKNGEYYLVSPQALHWDNEYYYLIAYDSDAEIVKHFRVDKILKVFLVEQKREGLASFEDFDMARYSQTAFGMYGGEQMTVRIMADNSLIGVVLDRFGVGVTILNHEDCFEFCVKVMVSPTFLSWVLGFGGKMKILSPESVAAEAVKLAKEALARYETE